jgi:NADH-quinone oxidoreductase subunit G
VRDDQIVQVKARANDAVNKEWLCDEGRYGFDRFLPAQRITQPMQQGKRIKMDAVLAEMKKFKDSNPIVFIAPDLLLEEYAVIKEFLERVVKKYQVAIGYKERQLTEVEKVLISPDYAANYRGTEFSGLVTGNVTARYTELLSRLRGGNVESVMFIGDRAIDPRDVDVSLLSGLAQVKQSVGILTDAEGQLASAINLVLPGRSILEKSGCMINRQNRLQYAERLVDFPVGTHAEWQLINQIAKHCGVSITDAESDRDLTLAILDSDSRLTGLTIKQIKAGGVALDTYRPEGAEQAGSTENMAV